MRVTRRAVLKGVLATGVGAVTGGGAYGYLYERHELEVTRATIPVIGLPPALGGLRIGLLTDVHRSRWVSHDDVMHAVEFGKPFSHCSVKLGLGYAVRQGIDHKPTHLEVAFAWSENRASGPEIFVNAWCKRP